MNAPVISFSRRLRVSPFELRSLEGSKSASVYNHLVLPTCYESLEADYWHLREHVQLLSACVIRVADAVSANLCLSSCFLAKFLVSVTC